MSTISGGGYSLQSRELFDELPTRAELGQFAPGEYGKFSTSHQENYDNTHIDQFHSDGPVSMQTKTGIAKLVINAGFSYDDMFEKKSKVVEVSWPFKQIMNLEKDDDVKIQMAKYDPKYCVPVSVRILGTNIDEKLSKLELQLYDNSTIPKRLHTVHACKTNSDCDAKESGFPLYLLKSGINELLISGNAKVDQNDINFWTLSINDLKNGSSKIWYPNSHQVDVIIDKDSWAAKMVHWAASYKNNIIPDLLNNEHYQYNHKVDKSLSEPPKKYIKIDNELYEDILAAYEDRFKEVKEKCYDFSQIKLRLGVLSGASLQELEKVKDLHVTVEVVARMALKSSVNDDNSHIEVASGLFSNKPSAPASSTVQY